MLVNVLLKLNVLCTPVISSPGRLRQEICKVEASLRYIVRLSLNKTHKTQQVFFWGTRSASPCPPQGHLHCTLRITEALAVRLLPGSCREQLSSCWARWAVTVKVLVPPEKACPPTLSSLEVVASCSCPSRYQASRGVAEPPATRQVKAWRSFSRSALSAQI